MATSEERASETEDLYSQFYSVPLSIRRKEEISFVRTVYYARALYGDLNKLTRTYEQQGEKFYFRNEKCRGHRFCLRVRSQNIEAKVFFLVRF